MAVLSAVLIAFAISGCGDDAPTPAVEAPTTETSDSNDYGYGGDEPRKNKEGELLPPPVQIYGADNSGKKVSEDTLVIVRSQSAFERLQKQLFKGEEERPLPGTDFKTRQMIVALLEPKDDGASAQITTVRKRKDGFTVTALRLLPGKGCRNDLNTRPYSIVETDRLKGTPKLIVEDQRQPACK